MQIIDARGALIGASARQPLLEGARDWMGIV
jgi:ethanolamine ammonia-lyase large subunit